MLLNANKHLNVLWKDGLYGWPYDEMTVATMQWRHTSTMASEITSKSSDCSTAGNRKNIKSVYYWSVVPTGDRWIPFRKGR